MQLLRALTIYYLKHCRDKVGVEVIRISVRVRVRVIRVIRVRVGVGVRVRVRVRVIAAIEGTHDLLSQALPR